MFCLNLCCEKKILKMNEKDYIYGAYYALRISEWYWNSCWIAIKYIHDVYQDRALAIRIVMK